MTVTKISVSLEEETLAAARIAGGGGGAQLVGVAVPGRDASRETGRRAGSRPRV